MSTDGFHPQRDGVATCGGWPCFVAGRRQPAVSVVVSEASLFSR